MTDKYWSLEVWGHQKGVPLKYEDVVQVPESPLILKDRADEEQFAAKYDSDKLMMALLEPEFLEEMAKALTYGAKTYGVFNWKKGFDWSRMLSAEMRHVNKWRRGEKYDNESKAHHLAAAAVNLMFLYYHEKDGLGRNDLRTIK